MCVSLSPPTHLHVSLCYADMSQAAMLHPFAITNPLDDSFGFTSGFLKGTIPWDSKPSEVSASTGGGRHAMVAVLDLVTELGRLTTEGAPLKERQTTLATLFHHHYNDERIQAYVHLMLSKVVKSSARFTKTEAIDLLVKNNVPFIPFEIFNDHLTRGLRKFKSKATYPQVDWAPNYKKFCTDVPFDGGASPKRSPGTESKKQDYFASFWQDAFSSHNTGKPSKQQLHLSKDEIEKFTGSQYTISVGGTPAFHNEPTKEMAALRAKLVKALEVSKTNKIAEALLLEQKAKKLRESAGSVSSSSSVVSAPPKRKRDHHDSDGDDDRDNGLHALDLFMKTAQRRVDDAKYIDFASLSSDRLRSIKMLNSTSVKESRISAGLVLKSSLSEADVVTLSDDLPQIFDGFFFHYIKLISESHLPTPMATILDRLSWWKWVADNFKGNSAAQVMFIKSFVVDHHSAPFWEPLVKQETTLVLHCKDQCHTWARPAPKASSNPKPPQYPKTKATGKGGKGQTKFAPLTTAQQAKFDAWRLRFPGVCQSRVVRGRTCSRQGKGQTCKYSHNCAWCGSATCEANCSQAELL